MSSSAGIGPGMTNNMIPGTVFGKSDMGNVNGLEFLNKIFYITDGIMLSQIRDITGLDSSTLQNWVKRGWINKPHNKKYSKDQLARILIVNMLRRNMRLEKIDFLLRYINGQPDNVEDDTIRESELYGYVTSIIDEMAASSNTDSSLAVGSLRTIVHRITKDYAEPVAGAHRRLDKALEIIVLTYYSAMVAQYADDLYEKLK